MLSIASVTTWDSKFSAVELRGDGLDRVAVVVERVVEQDELLRAWARGVVDALGVGEDADRSSW